MQITVLSGFAIAAHIAAGSENHIVQAHPEHSQLIDESTSQERDVHI